MEETRGQWLLCSRLTYLKLSLVPSTHLPIFPTMTWILKTKDVSVFKHLAAGFCPARACFSPLCPPYMYTHTLIHSHTHVDTHTQWSVRGVNILSWDHSVVFSSGLPKLPYGTFWCPLTYKQKPQEKRAVLTSTEKWKSIWILLSPKCMKVGTQQQNILFTWPSSVKWAGKSEVLECRFMVTSVLNQLWACQQGPDVTFPRFQHEGPFLQSDLSKALLGRWLLSSCHLLNCTSWARNAIATTLWKYK